MINWKIFNLSARWM